MRSRSAGGGQSGTRMFQDRKWPSSKTSLLHHVSADGIHSRGVGAESV